MNVNTLLHKSEQLILFISRPWQAVRYIGVMSIVSEWFQLFRDVNKKSIGRIVSHCCKTYSSINYGVFRRVKMCGQKGMENVLLLSKNAKSLKNLK